MSTFQQRHYNAIAASLSTTKSSDPEPIVRELAALFAVDNERFNKDKFIEACKPNKEQA